MSKMTIDKLAGHGNKNDSLQKNLQGCRVALFCTDGVEQIELLDPQKALVEAGAHAEIVSLNKAEIQAWNHDKTGRMIKADHMLSDVSAEDFDALVLPGGVMNPDTLRASEEAVQFVKDFVAAGKPIAAICHGPWTLIEAGAVQGRKMTSWPSLKTDLRNAGAQWADAPVVHDELLVTSRKPDDLPDFNREMIALFAQGSQGAQKTKQSNSSLHAGAVAPGALI